MSDPFPSSTVVDTPEWHQTVKPVPAPSRRRDKVQLSCVLCRRRKKCDRNHPCETCSTRGLSLSCTYVPFNKHGRLEQSRSPQSSSTSIQNRISQLEGLIVSLMNTLKAKESSIMAGCPEKPLTPANGNQTEATKGETDPQTRLPDTFGRLSIEHAETSYVGSAHWIAILDGVDEAERKLFKIAELKDHFEDADIRHDDHAFATEQPAVEGPQLLFGSNKYATKHEIVTSLPSRRIVDRLISVYFNTMDMAPVVIHSPTFLKEYEQFWENPLATPVMWLGLLVSMICLATQFQQFSADEPGGTHQPFQSSQHPQHLLQLYREKIVQCLVLGKYTKSVPYTIETLLLYFTIEHFQCKDTEIGTWILLGIIVRIAMRMGYHRDPSHSPRISPFHGEMRRRAWAMIVQLDLITSSQIGLPRMIQESQSDTVEPRNLLDDDFDEDMIELPAPRPDTDMTPILYFVARKKLLSVFGNISDLATSAQSSSYSEVMRLDGILNEARLAIPPGLQMRPMAKSIIDHPDIVMRRIHLDLIFHKAQCVLHRKYLISARSNSQHAYSRQSCIEAALQILQHQSMLNQEMQPGGQLYRDRWKVSSLVNHDFFLAATILCLDLDPDLAARSSSQINGEAADKRRGDDVTHALHKSYKIWLKSSKSSREAQKAAEALNIVLEKVKAASVAREADNVNNFPELSFVSTNAFAFPTDPPFSSKQPSPHRSSSTTTMNDQFPASILSHISASTPSPPSIMEEISNMANGFEWDKWDSQFQVPGLFQEPL